MGRSKVRVLSNMQVGVVLVVRLSMRFSESVEHVVKGIARFVMQDSERFFNPSL